MEPNDYRLRAIERRLDELERAEPKVLAERVAGLGNRLSDFEKRTDDNFEDQGDEISGLRKAIITAAISLTASSILIAATVYTVFS